MLFFRGSLPKSVLTAQKKTAVIFSKWLFFQNSLVISWATLLGKMQLKKLNIFLNFSLVKIFNLLESYFLCTGLYWKNFHEFCVIHMQQIIVFNNKRCKWNMILQNLKTLFQNSGKYGQKGHFESWAPIGSWNSFYDKICIFSKGLTWHRSFQQEPAGNRSKIGF